MNELMISNVNDDYEIAKKIKEILDENTSNGALRKFVECLENVSSKYITDLSIINGEYNSEELVYRNNRDNEIENIKEKCNRDKENIERAANNRINIIDDHTKDIADKKERMKWATGSILKRIKDIVKGSAIRKCRVIGKDMARMGEAPSTVEIINKIKSEKENYISSINSYYDNEKEKFIKDYDAKNENAQKRRDEKIKRLEDETKSKLKKILSNTELLDKFDNYMKKRILFADYKGDNVKSLPDYYDLGYISLDVPSGIIEDSFLKGEFDENVKKWVERKVLHGNEIRIPLIAPRKSGYSIVLPCYDRDMVTSFALRNSMLFPVGKMLYTIICAPLVGVFSAINGIKREERFLTGGKFCRTEREIENKLKEINDTIHGLSNNYFGSIEQREKREPFHTVFVYDYDNAINEASKKYLRDMVDVGPGCGVNFIFFCDDVDKVDNSAWGNAIVVKKAKGTYGKTQYYAKYKNFKYRYDMGEVLNEAGYEPIIKEMSEYVGVNNLINYRFEELIPNWRDISTYFMGGSSAAVLDVPIAFVGTSTFHWVIGKRGSDDRHHTMIEGTTGNGKTELLQAMMMSLFYKYSPEEVQVCFMDYKDGVGEQYFKNIAYTKKIIAQGDREAGCALLKECVNDMRNRYEEFKRVGNVEDIFEYREKTTNKMPRIIVVIEEVSGLINIRDTIASDVVQYISEIAQRGRAAGYHLILTAQGFETMGLSPDVGKNFTHRFSCIAEGKCIYNHFTKGNSESGKPLNTVYVRPDIPEFLGILSQYTAVYDSEIEVKGARIISGAIEDHIDNALNSFEISDSDVDRCEMHIGYYTEEEYELSLSPTNSSMLVVCPENTNIGGLISDSCTIITYMLLSIIQNGIFKYDLSNENDFISIVAIEPLKKYEKELEKFPIRFADYTQYVCADGNSSDDVYEDRIQAIKDIISNLYELYKNRAMGIADSSVPKYLVVYGLHRTKPLRKDNVFDININPLMNNAMNDSDNYMGMLRELIEKAGKYNIYVISWTDKNYEKVGEYFNCRNVAEIFSTTVASAMGAGMANLVEYNGNKAESERHAYVKRRMRSEGHEISLFQMPTDKWIDEFSEKCKKYTR